MSAMKRSNCMLFIKYFNESHAMKITESTVLFSLFLVICNLMSTTAHCQGRYEQSRGSVSQTGMKHRAMLGHSFRNFTHSKTYDCHVKCFDERCRCQAYQMWRDRCELLDEDRLSAPGDFVKEEGYTYFDMEREYVNQVRVTYPYPSRK